MLSTKELLTEAKNLLVTEGWVQGEWDNEGGYCSSGALQEVIRRHLEDGNICDDEVMGVFLGGYDRLCTTLRDTDRIANVVAFNDAKHRTEQEVLDLFDLAAQGAGGE